MKLAQWGMLLSILGFVMATLFAALLMEHRIVGSFADWLSNAFGEIHSRLGRTFPMPRRRLIGVMYRYSVQSLALVSGAIFLAVPHHFMHSINIWISIALIIFAGVLPLVVLYKQSWDEEGGEANLYLEVRMFAACLVHEVVMLLISPFVLVAVFLLEFVRGLFGFLSYRDDAKKLFVILGTMMALSGYIIQFTASFR